MYAKASAKLDSMPNHHGGIALDELRVAVKGFFAVALEGKPAATPPKIRRLRNAR